MKLGRLGVEKEDGTAVLEPVDEAVGGDENQGCSSKYWSSQNNLY